MGVGIGLHVIDKFRALGGQDDQTTVQFGWSGLRLETYIETSLLASGRISTIDDDIMSSGLTPAQASKASGSALPVAGVEMLTYLSRSASLTYQTSYGARSGR